MILARRYKIRRKELKKGYCRFCDKERNHILAFNSAFSTDMNILSTIRVAMEKGNLIASSSSTQEFEEIDRQNNLTESENTSTAETIVQINYCPMCGKNLKEEA